MLFAGQSRGKQASAALVLLWLQLLLAEVTDKTGFITRSIPMKVQATYSCCRQRLLLLLLLCLPIETAA